MNNKKIQAHMQINVSFLGDTTKLVKQLEDTTKKLNLEGSFTKQLGANLTKGFKEVYTNIEKMNEGLSKKGLSAKQYVSFFNEMNGKLKESIKFTQNLKKDLQDAFNSPENKQALKDLEKYRKQLEEIKKLAASKKGATTRSDSAVRKMQEETGIDYNIAKRTLNSIANRKANSQGLTKAQQEWAAANGLDEVKLKRVLELLKQINAQTKKQKELNDQAKQLTGQATVESSESWVSKKIQGLESNVITPEMNKHNAAVGTSVENINKALNEATENHIPKFQGALNQGTLEAEKLAKAGSTLQEIFAQFGITFSVASIVRGFKDLIISSFEFYKSLDSALNEIYIVSNLTSEAVQGLKGDFINMAKDTGMALDDITRAATLFYQQGLNTEAVMEMTRVTSQFAKVAGIDATDAADKLTAAVNGYCLAAEDASMVADKFNKVAAASAADIDELSTAFSKAAAQANQAGVGMDNYLAYIATMVEATREAPENIGTSLKTIMSRMQQVKMGGTTEDGETDVNQVETALESVGISLRDVNGELRDLEEVFAELGPKWQSLDRNTQAYLGTIIAGTRQQSRFITLMQNWDRVLDLADQSANSAGQQALMHAKAMDSIESKVQQFQVAWQEFISNLTDSSIIKGIITVATKLLDVFNGGTKPIALMSIAVGALSSKLKDLAEPLKNRIKDVATFLKTGKNTATGNYFSSDAEKEAAINKNQEAQWANEAELLKVQAQQKLIHEQIATLKNKELATGKLTTKQQNQLNKLTEQESQLQTEINNKKKHGNQLDAQGKKLAEAEILTKKQAIGQTATKAGMAISGLGIALGQADENAGGLVSSLGGITTAVGQVISGDYIGAAISAATAVYQLVQTISNWEETIAKKMSDAVDKVKEAADKAANLTVSVESSEDLIKEYNKLSQKVVKTTAEQERMNAVAQELGDTHGVDVLTDSYGNLSVKIDDVTESLAKMREEQLKAIQELKEAEVTGLLDATTGLGNDNTVGEYYEELLKTNRVTYKSMLSGVETELTDDVRNVSSSLANEFSSNFVDSIYSEVERNAAGYTGDSLIGAMSNFNTSINAKVTDKEWNQLYAELGDLEQSVQDMSYNEVQAKLEEFYNTWGKANDLTLEEWNILKDAINNTVFENKSLLEFYGKVDEMNSKASGKYYEDNLAKINADIDKVDKSSAALEGSNAMMAVGGTAAVGGGVMAGLTAFGAANVWNPVGWASLAVAGIAAIGGGIALMNTEEAKQQRALNKTRKELEKERDEYLEQIDEENAYLHGTDEAERWINAQTKVADALKTLTAEQQNYLGNIDTMFDFSGLTADQSEQFANSISGITKGMEGLDTDTQRANYILEYANKMLEDPELEDSVREKWQGIIDDTMANLQLPTAYTFSQIADELDSVSANLREVNALIEEFEENGSMSLDSFKGLAKILDSIKLEDLYAVSDLDKGINYVDDYIAALKNLNLAYDENSGQITMNGESLQTLQQIQQVQAKAEITNMKNQLIAKKYQTLAEIAYIDAQIAGAEAAMDILNNKAAAEIKASELTKAANDATKTSFTNTTNALNDSYATDVQNMNTWTMAVVSDLDTATQAWGKYWSAAAGNDEDLSALLNEAKKGQDVKFEKAGDDKNMFDDAAGSDGKFNQKEVDALKADLQSYIDNLNNLKDKYNKTLEVYDAEIEVLESMENADLSKLGTSGKDAEELDKYIGKLKEIYNILNRIQLLEHRLSTLDTYSEVARGEEYGQYLKQRMNYTDELLDQYEFLVKEQKKFTNGYKEFIESSAVADVFDFDEFGQIIINFEKYNKLQDTAANGEKSLKEQADELYETYTSMFEELHGYFDEYIAYLQKAIDLHNEVIDSYIDVENKAADAIKEIYQKILDTRLDAIDQEREALEELKDAREQARKDQENAKEISNLQTNIQRTMMDSSGASEISFIKAQQDMNDKLEDIADDKYSEMLDNIINRLDEEKDALQENFDEMFSNTEWLFEFIESNIMNDQEKLEELFKQTDDWATKNNLERAKELEELDKQFHTYMTNLEGGKSIYNVWEKLGELKDATKALDEALKTREVNVGTAVANAISEGIKAGTGGGSGNGGGGSNNNYYKRDNTGGGGGGGGGDDSTKPPVDYQGDLYAGLTVELDREDYKYTKYTDKTGKGKSTFTDSGWFDNNLEILEGPTWSPELQKYVVKVKMDGKTFWMPASADTYGAGISKYFHSREWFNSGAKYANGGFADFTGLAWMDGTKQKPEAVLNALQTEHFIKFTHALDNMFSSGNMASTSSTVSIDTISFNVESMSSPEDGEAAFNMFVNKFKEIGSQSGIKIDSFKNRL